MWGEHIKLVAVSVLVLPGSPLLLGSDSTRAFLVPAVLLPVYLIIPFWNPQGSRRVLFTHDAQLIPYQPFLTELNPCPVVYVVYN